MPSVFITRKLHSAGIDLLREKGYEIICNPHDRDLTKEEFLDILSKNKFDAVLCMLTNSINAETFDASPSTKIFSNYAVGYNNVDIEEATKRSITITNTPGVLTESVAEHTMALMLASTSRVVDGDRFIREGRFRGWEPLLLLGTDLKDKTLSVIGSGRIGSRVAEIAHKGFGMKIVYFDIKKNEKMEQELNANFKQNIDDALKQGDIITLHMPLLKSTEKIINEGKLNLMKKDAYLINTSRGKIIDEKALVRHLNNGNLKGVALDVFEEEPKLAEGLAEIERVVLTPHTASATEETRGKMSVIAAENIIAALEGGEPKFKVS
ncbi:MAG: D-glycerate dehydrogenase [Candidatus Campbellbacteria bacterium]|nr:D-glycerate dehydrogenase [Candidatus Campbellbacteria bacterium]